LLQGGGGHDQNGRLLSVMSSAALLPYAGCAALTCPNHTATVPERHCVG
jgi:hypothetical protein